jgi:hypothetical protein
VIAVIAGLPTAFAWALATLVAAAHKGHHGGTTAHKGGAAVVGRLLRVVSRGDAGRAGLDRRAWCCQASSGILTSRECATRFVTAFWKTLERSVLAPAVLGRQK